MTSAGPNGIESVPRVQLALDELPQQDRFDAWRTAADASYDIASLGPESGFRGQATVRLADGLVFSRTRFSASGFTRGRRELSNGADSISVRWYRFGEARFRVADHHDLVQNRGTVAVHDFAQPCMGESTDADVIGVEIPRVRVHAHGQLRSRRPAMALSMDRGPGLLLGRALSATWEALEHATVEEGRVLAEGLVGLLNGMLGADLRGDDGREAAAMQTYLRGALAEPDLGVADLMRVFHRSRSAVYRAFEEHGGVAAFIRRERLRRCYDELTRPGGPTRRITHVATDWGFRDPAYFSRVFKQQYGVSPSHLVRRSHPAESAAGPLSDDDVPDEAITIRRWLRRTASTP